MIRGSAFEQVTRQKVDDLKDGFIDMKTEFRTELRKVNENQTKLFNHMSTRISPSVAIIVTILTGMVVGLVVRAYG